MNPMAITHGARYRLPDGAIYTATLDPPEPGAPPGARIRWYDAAQYNIRRRGSLGLPHWRLTQPGNRLSVRHHGAFWPTIWSLEHVSPAEEEG